MRGFFLPKPIVEHNGAPRAPAFTPGWELRADLRSNMKTVRAIAPKRAVKLSL